LSDTDKAALRALIRDELGAALTAKHEVETTHEVARRSDVVLDASTRTAEQALAGLTRDQRVSYDDATSLVSDGIDRGTWTADDRQQLNEKIRSLPSELVLAVVQPLIVAVNSQKVHLAVRGPIF
jgi:hypothetical protein